MPLFSNYDEFLFFVMAALAVVAVSTAWLIEHSWVGRGMAAIRDNEEAAECMGVPILKIKLFATTVSGALMGIAGAPFSYFVVYIEPTSAFHLDYAVNSLAMPMIGGTTTWLGPLVGAILVGTAPADSHRHPLLGDEPAHRGQPARGLRGVRSRRPRGPVR